jgi:hypothetical protein
MHPRLALRRRAIAKHLHLEDSTEINAALEELETLFYRCGYHLASSTFGRRESASQRARTRPVATTRRVGRPVGSANWANRQLGLGLATIWAEQTGLRPARRFNPTEASEYGPYRDFVACVVNGLPRRLLATRKGAVPAVEHLVRISIEEWKSAQASADKVRRQGLLDESRWAGLSPSTDDSGAN